MWLACALIILFSVGFVLPCMLDITMTPDSEFTTFSKGTWLAIAGAFWIFGATAWLLVGRPQRLGVHRSNPYPPGSLSPSEALLRHPATQAAGYADLAGPIGVADRRPLGPDDDPDFISELGRRIRESREDTLGCHAPWRRLRPSAPFVMRHAPVPPFPRRACDARPAWPAARR